MAFFKEDIAELSDGIDCYWQADIPEGRDTITYPSLPEPYVNLFFPVDSGASATIKGISSETDFFEMRAALFGVRLYLRGFYQMDIGPACAVSNRISTLETIGGATLSDLVRTIGEACSFEARMEAFRTWYRRMMKRPVEPKQGEVADALDFLLENYRDPAVISSYAEYSGHSPRTVSRWFSGEIGISPKKLARIARFHTALAGLHDDRTPGFWLDCGYYDQAHFIREFREFTGITPEEYAKMVS